MPDKKKYDVMTDPMASGKAEPTGDVDFLLSLMTGLGALKSGAQAILGMGARKEASTLAPQFVQAAERSALQGRLSDVLRQKRIGEIGRREYDTTTGPALEEMMNASKESSALAEALMSELMSLQQPIRQSAGAAGRTAGRGLGSAVFSARGTMSEDSK